MECRKRRSEGKRENREAKANKHTHRRVTTIPTIVIANETAMVTEKRKRQLNLALGRAREIKKKKNQLQEVSRWLEDKF